MEQIAAFLENIDWVTYTAPLTDWLASLDLAEILNNVITFITNIVSQFAA